MPPPVALALTFLLLTPSAATCLQLAPEALRERTNSAEFAKGLRELLSAVKIGTAPSRDPWTCTDTGPPIPAVFAGVLSWKVVLPGGTACGMTPVFYMCTWETKPNKNSVVILQNNLSASIAAALPEGWTREAGETLGLKYTNFTDPTGEIVITVKCPVSIGDFPLSSYTATLTIHRSQLRVL